MKYQYQIKGKYFALLTVRTTLWLTARITSEQSNGKLTVNLKNLGELKLLQNVCNEMGLTYTQI